MSETKFTPGPWVQFADHGNTVAIMPAMRRGDICTFEKPPTRADANLIAAAPDLYEALEAAREQVIRWMIECGIEAGAADRYLAPIDGALRKARGES